MKKLLYCLAAVVMGMASSASAAVTPISVNGVAGPFTFGAAPTLAEGWSTMNWAGAAVTSGETPATIDAKVQTNVASAIITALGTAAAGNPPAQVSGPARWNPTGLNIFTRPTSVNGDLIMATLQNGTGLPVTTLTLDYDLTVEGSAATVEEVYGHGVYYSLTGAASTWIQFTGGPSADGSLGTFHKTLTNDLTLTPWVPGANLYVLWTDDNGSGSPDEANEIDNVTFTVPTIPTMPAFANNTDPTNRSVLQCRSTTFSAGTATGNPRPTYQWYKNDAAHPITDATNVSYTITNAASTDAGSYFVRAHNLLGDADSHAAVLTYVPVTFGVVRALGGTNHQSILLSFSLPIASVDGSPGFQFVVSERVSGAQVTVNSSAIVNGTNILIDTDTRFPGVNYDVLVDPSDPLPNTCSADTFSGNVQLSSAVFLLDIDDVQTWRYNDTGVDPGPTWMNVGYNDSAWLQGKALFDGKKVSPLRTDITNIPVRTELVLTNIAAYNFTNDIPTYNFRTHINVTALPDYLEAVTVWDDGGALFINGTDRFRNRNATTNVFAVYSNVGAITGEGWFEGPFSLPPSDLAVGDNTIAVETKQVNAGSSDATMGLQLIGYYATLPAVAPTLSRTYTGGNLTLTWTSGTLQTNSVLGNASGWHDVGGATSPFPVNNVPGQTPKFLFYRLR